MEYHRVSLLFRALRMERWEISLPISVKYSKVYVTFSVIPDHDVSRNAAKNYEWSEK